MSLGSESNRFQVGQFDVIRNAELFCVFVVLHHVASHFVSQFLKIGIEVQRGPVAWSRQRNGELAAQCCFRTGSQRHDAVCHQDGFVDVVGNHQNRSLVLFPDTNDFVLQHGTRQRVQRTQWFVEQAECEVASTSFLPAKVVAAYRQRVRAVSSIRPQ